jgi:hypothetical protein
MEMKTSNKQFDEFSTHDLHQAAFFQANNLPLIRSERLHGRVWFVFPGGSKADELRTQYRNNGLVRVGDYRRCLQDLKTEIFSTT